MLVMDFYQIESKHTQDDGSVVYNIKLNAQHNVYNGHFPERPITPGVCNIQMIKELAEDVQGRLLTLSEIDRCRLTSMVTPDGSPDLCVKIQTSPDDNSKINATIFYGDTTYMTLSGVVTDRLS